MQAYWKRYLCVPKWSNNGITNFLMQAKPLFDEIVSMIPQECGSFPLEFNGVQLTFKSTSPEIEEYKDFENIPSFFWTLKTVFELPASRKARREFTQGIYDLHHYKLCSHKVFHHTLTEQCICKLCRELMEHFHFRKHWQTEI